MDLSPLYAWEDVMVALLRTCSQKKASIRYYCCSQTVFLATDTEKPAFFTSSCPILKAP